MKKFKLGIVLLAFSMTTLVGCSSKEKTDTKTSSSSSSSEVVKESSSSKTKESSSSSATSSDPLTLIIESAQSQIPTIKEQLGSMYSDIEITRGEGDTILYTYTYAQEFTQKIDAEAMKPTLAKSLKPAMDAAKAMVPDVKMQVIILNPDKSEVANITITQEDVEKASE